jgi:hypothetical protein
MVERENRRRWRRVLILALFLLIPALLSDLPFLSRTGHPGHSSAHPGAAAPEPGLGGSEIALLPLDPNAWHPGHGGPHSHAASGAETGGEDDSGPIGGTLQNLVYRMQDDGADADHDGDGSPDFGGDGHGGGSGFGGGGGFSPSGFGGNDPGTDNPPFPFTPDPDGGSGDKGGDSPFLPPLGPAAIAAVPEPATWALFILGFGFIGAQLRRARQVRHVPALTHARNKRLG